MKTRILTATIAAFLVGHASLKAASFTWDGGAFLADNDWSNAGNWSPNGSPPSDGTADLLFAGSTRLNAEADAAWSIASLTFAGNAGAFTIQGSPLTIGAGGVTTNAATQQDIANNIILAAAQTFRTAGNFALDINGTVSTSGHLLTVEAAAGNVFLSGVVSGSGGLKKIGQDTLQLDGATGNIYSGTTTVLTGVLELAKTGGVIAIPGALTVSGGTVSVVLLASNQIANGAAVTLTSGGTLDLNGFSDLIGSLSLSNSTVQTGAGTLSLGGNVVSPAAGFSLISGALDLNGARTFDVGNFALERDLAVTATIANGSILKTGAGTLVLGGANTFAGGVTVSVGELMVSGSSGAGTGPLIINAGAAIRSEFDAATLPNAVTIAGDANFTGIRDLTFTGATTLSGSRTLNVTNSAQTIFSGSFSSDTLLSSITKTGSGTLTLSGTIATTSVGPTIVNDGRLLLGKTAGVTAVQGTLTIGDGTHQASVELGASNQIANASSVIINTGGRFNLANFSETIGALTLHSATVFAGAGTLTVGGNITATAPTVTSVISGDLNLGGATRTFDVSDGPGSVDLNMAGEVSNGGVLKTGSGALVLATSNTFAGGLTVNGGEVSLGSNTSAGTGLLVLNDTARVRSNEQPLVLANLLTIGGNITVSGAQELALGGATTLTGTRTITTTNTALTSLNGVIGQDAAGRGLLKAGTRTLSIGGSAANTFTGPVNVNEGTLLLAKTGGVNAVVGSTFIVGDGIGGSQADRVQLRAPNQIGNTTPVTVRSSGFLDLNNFDETIPSLGIEGGAVETGSGLLTVTGPIDVLASNFSANISGHLSLGGGVRTIAVANGSDDFDMFLNASITDGSITKAGGGLLAITGPQSYSALLAQAGTTKLFTPLGSGTSTVNVTPTGASAMVDFNTSQTLASLTIGNGGVVNLENEPVPAPPGPFGDETGAVILALNANTGTTNIGADETLAALNIADGATVTIGAIPPPAPPFGGEELPAGSPSLPVPEPGSLSLLAIGVSALIGRPGRVVRSSKLGNDEREISPSAAPRDPSWP